MKACCSRRTGRARACINSDNTDYREHRMKTVYARSSMAVDCRRTRNSRSMQPIGHYCFKCQQFWTDDQVYKIMEELQEKRIQQYLSSPGAKKWTWLRWKYIVHFLTVGLENSERDRFSSLYIESLVVEVLYTARLTLLSGSRSIAVHFWLRFSRAHG